MTTKQKLTDDEAAKAFMDFDPDKAKKFERNALATIENAVARRAAAQDDIDNAVHEAREAGIPWMAIGAALGVSHQAAMQRYKR